MIDSAAAGIRTVMTGAMLRFMRSTIARKTSGVKVCMDLLKAIHGPENIPATKAERTMLISSQIFIVNAPIWTKSISEQSARAILAGSKCGEGFFEGGRVFDVEGGDGGVAAEDLAVEAGEDFAGADLDEVSWQLSGEEVDALDPADGAGDLADEGVAGVGVAGGEAGVDVGGYGDGGVVEGDAFELDHQGFLRGLHEGAMEGCADLQHDGLFGAGGFAEVGGAVDGGGGAGDDGLVGRVEVGGGDGGLGDDVAADFGAGLVGVGFEAGELFAELFAGLGAEVVDLVRGQAEDGGHCALSGGNGLLHEAAAGADGLDGVREGEGSGGYVGGVFAERMPGGVGGCDAVFGEDARDGDGDGEDGGLGVLGELEVFFRAFEDELGEREAEGVVGLDEGDAGGREGFVEGESHADGLGALAGEEKDWLDHWYLS